MKIISFYLCFCIGLLCLVAVVTVPTPVTTVDRRCPLYYYYDHGTEKCEFCCDICCYAKQKSTSKQCDSQCPAYAKKLQYEARNILDNRQDLQNPGQGQDAEHTLAGDLPLAAQIGIPLAGCVLLLLLLSFIYMKREVIVELFRKRQTPTGDDANDPAAMPLRPVGTSVPPDTDSREQDIHLEAEDQTASSQPPLRQSGPPTDESLEGRLGNEEIVPSGARREGANRNRGARDNTEVKMVPQPHLTSDATV